MGRGTTRPVSLRRPPVIHDPTEQLIDLVRGGLFFSPFVHPLPTLFFSSFFALFSLFHFVRGPYVGARRGLFIPAIICRAVTDLMGALVPDFFYPFPPLPGCPWPAFPPFTTLSRQFKGGEVGDFSLFSFPAARTGVVCEVSQCPLSLGGFCGFCAGSPPTRSTQPGAAFFSWRTTPAVFLVPLRTHLSKDCGLGRHLL